MLLFRGPTGATAGNAEIGEIAAVTVENVQTAGNAVTVENVQTVVSVLGTAPAIVPQIAPGMTIQTTLMVGAIFLPIQTIQIHVRLAVNMQMKYIRIFGWIT